MPRVFVTQEIPVDFSPAEVFGDVVFCSRHEITPTKGGFINQSTIAGIKSTMVEYIPGEDYILLSGSPIAIAHCLMAAFKRGPTHNLLKWDGQRGAYMHYEVKDDGN